MKIDPRDFRMTEEDRELIMALQADAAAARHRRGDGMDDEYERGALPWGMHPLPFTVVFMATVMGLIYAGDSLIKAYYDHAFEEATTEFVASMDSPDFPLDALSPVERLHLHGNIYYLLRRGYRTDTPDEQIMASLAGMGVAQIRAHVATLRAQDAQARREAQARRDAQDRGGRNSSYYYNPSGTGTYRPSRGIGAGAGRGMGW